MKNPTETLDPENWEELRELSHQVVDDMLNYLKSVGERPIWKSMPDETKSFFEKPLPHSGRPLDKVYEDIKENVLAYPMGNIHPRFWGWVLGNGTYQGALSDFIASTMNSNTGGGNHSANYIEKQVIDWSKEMLGYDEDASGLLTSGGSMANLIGLTVARHHQAKHEIRKKGVDNHKFRYYGSSEMHSSIQKSIELLGIGYENLVKIPVNDKFQIDLNNLEKAIEDDIAKGLQPVCIIGNLGTVNTGATDDLHALADLAEKYGLWYHIDGAFGAITKITPTYKYLADGIERADSIAFDFHKWMYVNYEAGCVLVRHKKSHYQSFSLTPEYLTHNPRGVHGGDLWFSDYGVELSRGFKALKIWTSISEHGIEKYGRIVEQNIEQAKYLTELVNEEDKLEQIAPTAMNIVCFRYIPENRDKIDEINEEILIQLHEQGIAVPSYTNLHGNYVLRAAITNHRSKLDDFDVLVKEVIRLGDKLSSEM